MPRRPWYRRYPADYLADTAHLSFCEHGAYTLLLELQYHLRTGFEPSWNRVRHLTRAQGKKENEALRTVLAQFFEAREDDGGRLWNPRAFQEITSDNEARAKMAKKGREGAARRWGTPRKDNGVPDHASDRVTIASRARPDPDPEKDPPSSEFPVVNSHARARAREDRGEDGECGLTHEQRAEAERIQLELERRRGDHPLATVGAKVGERLSAPLQSALARRNSEGEEG